MQKYKFKTLVERIKDTVDPNSVASNYPYIGLANIEPGSFEINEIGKAKDVNSTKYKFNSGDVLYGKLRPYFHKSYMPNFDGICSTDIWVLRTKDERLLKQDYLYHIVRTPYFDSITNISTGGTDRPRAKWDYIKEQTIDVPEISVQNAISSFLNSIDKLIDNNSHRIEILEQMAKTIYREWFVEFCFPGHKEVPLVDSELGEIPEGWKVKPIGEAIDTIGGGTPRTKQEEYWNDGEIVWFTPSDLTKDDTMFIKDSSRHINKLGLQNSSAKMFPPYSVMMTSRATIGVTSINTVEACTNQGFIICVPNQKISVYQIYFWIEQNMEKIINFASGATYKEINKTTFRKIPIVIPDSKTNMKFNSTMNPIGKLIKNLIDQNNKLSQMRDLLLPKLFTGELSTLY